MYHSRLGMYLGTLPSGYITARNTYIILLRGDDGSVSELSTVTNVAEEWESVIRSAYSDGDLSVQEAETELKLMEQWKAYGYTRVQTTPMPDLQSYLEEDLPEPQESYWDESWGDIDHQSDPVSPYEPDSITGKGGLVDGLFYMYGPIIIGGVVLTGAALIFFLMRRRRK